MKIASNEFAVKHTGISEEFGKKVLRFWDFDDQAYQLISDELNQGVAAGIPWKKDLFQQNLRFMA